MAAATVPAEGSDAGRRLLRGMASLWDGFAGDGKCAIGATQQVTAAVLRLLDAARLRYEPVEVAAIERL